MIMSGSDESFDVLIVGGGIMGCCTAYYLLSTDPAVSVAVIEKDPTYQLASTALSMANIRIQFSLRENILISKYAMEVLERFGEEMEIDGEAPDPAFHREGNLFLFKEEELEPARAAMQLQQNLGCNVEWLEPNEIVKRFPLYKTDGFAGATFGPDDGHIDANSFLMGYRSKAKSLGAEFRRGEVVQVIIDKNRACGIELASGDKLKSEVVVNCAGAWAADLAKTAGIEIPVLPVKRQVFALDTEVKPEGQLPLTNLPSGLYFRTETGDLILCGKSLPEDQVGYDTSLDNRRFEDILWPELAAFVPAFDRLRLVRGWAGLYAVNTFDGNALLGEWPELEGFHLANGFSGHGLQQGPAVGRYLSELILKKLPALDLSIFSPVRLLEGRRVLESGLV